MIYKQVIKLTLHRLEDRDDVPAGQSTSSTIDSTTPYGPLPGFTSIPGPPQNSPEAAPSTQSAPSKVFVCVRLFLC